MNSVQKYLTADSKAATLLAMRSACKEVLLVVEGDADIDTFSNGLGVPRSNFLSCNGKEILMILYNKPPQKGIDSGTLFIRDRDNDEISTSCRDGIMLLVTSLYDIEMELLKVRLFRRIISDYTLGFHDDSLAQDEFSKLCKSASCLGAIRAYSHKHGLRLDFDDIKYGRFLDLRTMNIDIRSAVTYIYAKSNVRLTDIDKIVSDINTILDTFDPIHLVCSKDFLGILHLALCRHYGTCGSKECEPSVLSRIIRIATSHDDLKSLPLYQPLKSHVLSCGFPWKGNEL